MKPGATIRSDASMVRLAVCEAKLFAFGFSAAIAAVGGILLSFSYQPVLIGPLYPTMYSILLVVYVVIGSVGFLAGPLFGAQLVAGASLRFQSI